MKKIILLAVLLAGVLTLGFSQTGGSWTVTNTATWITAVNGIRSGGNNKAYTITVTGTVSVPPSMENTFGAGTGITVTMEGSGVLSLSGNGALLRIGENQTIIAKNITLRGRDKNNNSVVRIEKGGAFRMEGSAQVTGNNGYGVSIGEGGTFTMQDNASVSGNTNGGVRIERGTFTMQGKSSVSGNTFSGVSGSGTFTMQDNASVSGNTGGGVYVQKSGTFTMQGKSSVSGNTDGGVSVGEQGTFTMEDNASISGNTANNYGGGVWVYYGTFTMKGSASISGNTASDGGGGVTVNGGTFTKIGGTIYGNDADQRLRNTASNKKGHAVYDWKSRNWRNSTADSAMRSDSYGFWLNETD